MYWGAVVTTEWPPGFVMVNRPLRARFTQAGYCLPLSTETKRCSLAPEQRGSERRQPGAAFTSTFLTVAVVTR